MVDGRLRHDCGAADDFELGRFRIYELAGREIGVVRTVDGYFAVNNACPHQGAPICLGTVRGTYLPSAPGEYEHGLEGRVLSCPWHSWEFTIEDGSAVGGITSKRLTTYPVEVEDGRVYVFAGRQRGAA